MQNPKRDGPRRKGRRSPREFAVQVGVNSQLHLLHFDKGSVRMVRKNGTLSSRCPECHQELFYYYPNYYYAKSPPDYTWAIQVTSWSLVVMCHPKHTSKEVSIEIRGRKNGKLYTATLHIFTGKPKPVWERRGTRMQKQVRASAPAAHDANAPLLDAVEEAYQADINAEAPGDPAPAPWNPSSPPQLFQDIPVEPTAPLLILPDLHQLAID